METLETELETPKVRAMTKAGASREASYKAIADGLRARKVSVQKDGSTIDEPDHQVRLKAAEMIARMNGDLKADVMVDNRKVTIGMVGVSREAVKGLMEMAEDVKRQIEGLRQSGRQTGEVIEAVVTGASST